MEAIRSYAYLAYFLVFLCWGFCSAHRPVLTFKDVPVADKPGGLGIQKRFEGIWSWGNGGGGSIGYSPSGISGTIFDPRSGQGSGVGVDAGPGGSGHGSGGQASGSAGGGTSRLVVLVLVLVLTVEKLKVMKVLAMVQTVVLVLLVMVLTLGLEVVAVIGVGGQSH